MKINIKNYKNIENLTLYIEDNKINHIFGISGSGKSSIAQALSRKTDNEDIKVGSNPEDCVIEVNGNQVDYSKYSIFDLESSKNIIFNNEQSNGIYEVLFSENDLLLKTINECGVLLNKFEEFKEFLMKYREKIDNVINHFDVKLKTYNTVFKETSKFVKLTNELSSIKSNKFISIINKKGPDFITWIKKGKDYEIENKCPYCEKKLSNKRENFISEIIKLTPKNFEIITNDNNYLEDVGIKTPNYRHSREVNRAKRELIELYSMRDYINSIIELFEDYKTSKLDINKVQQIKISIKFKNKFPDKIEIINEINDSIKEIKNMLIKIKRQSNNIIKNNKNKVNKYLSLMGIPYEFNESAYDIESKTASYSLFLKEDKEKKDRKNGLSYGERNIISLIFFLLGNKNKILLIDDPASSYDECRRGLMFNMLYEFKNERTIILFSHDQVFVKIATLYKYKAESRKTKSKKFIKDNTGKIIHFSNYQHNSQIKEITIEDFGSLSSQVKKFIQNKELNYYRKIINIRILSEMDKNKSNKFKKIYLYSSAILHKKNKEEIYEQLKQNDLKEDEIISSIYKEYDIELEKIPENYFINFDINELSNFEKIYYFRELIAQNANVYSKIFNIEVLKKNDIDLLKTEFDNIVHFNDRLFISLNPYEFDYFSPMVYEIITNVK